MPNYVQNGRLKVIFFLHFLDFHIEGSQFFNARGASTILDQIADIEKDVTLSNEFKLGQMLHTCEAKVLV